LRHLEDRKVKAENRWEFERGFVDRATMSARTFLRGGAEIVQSTPLRWLHLTGVTGVLKKVRAHPPLKRVPERSLANNKLGSPGWRVLADAGVLGGMKGLYLGSTDFDQEAAMVLSWSPNLTNITTLNLAWTPIWGGLEFLAECPYLGSLESLMLIGAGVAAPQLQSLADPPYCDGL